MPTSLPKVTLKTKANRLCTRAAYNLRTTNDPVLRKLVSFTNYVSDWLTPPNTLNGGLEAPFLPVRSGFIEVTPAGIQRPLAMLSTPASGGKLPKVERANVERVFSSIMVMFATNNVLLLEEIALKTDFGVKLVHDCLTYALETGQDQWSDIRFRYSNGFISLTAARPKDFAAAEQRQKARYNLFVNTIVDLKTKIGTLPPDTSVGRIDALLENAREKLGIRFMDLLVYDPESNIWNAECKEVFGERNPLPPGFIRSIATAPVNVHAIKLCNGLAFDTQNAFEIDPTSHGFLKQLKSDGKQYLVTIRAQSAEGKPQALLLLTNPLFFGAEKKDNVVSELTQLADVLGAKLGEINAYDEYDTSGFDPEKEKSLWTTVHSQKTGGLEAMIGGPITGGHRQDFVEEMLGPIRDAALQGQVTLWEDAAGVTSIGSLVVENLKETPEHGGEKVLSPTILGNFSIIARDFIPEAVSVARQKISEAGLTDVIFAEIGDMFDRSKRSDASVDFFVACMAFYCSRGRVRRTLREWSRLAKPGAEGWFSLKEAKADMNTVKNKTIKSFIKAIPLWQKITLLPFVFTMISFIYKRWRSGAFTYGKALAEGFASGKYHSPNVPQIKEDLESAGLGLAEEPIRSLADTFLLVHWKKPQ
ncbi:MAG: methyltransferase domain-containing protein [bacterium]